MHVVNDWYRLYVAEDRVRVKSLCGSKVLMSNAGIPGITKLRPQSWCQECISELTLELYNWFNAEHAAANSIRMIYNTIASEVLRAEPEDFGFKNGFVEDLRKMLDGDFPPVWSPTSRSFNNPLFVVWSTLMDRVYDPSHPDHGKGWHKHEVDPRWFSFNNFIEDAPHKDLKAVYPDEAKSKVIGPNSCRYYQESPTGRISFG